MATPTTLELATQVGEMFRRRGLTLAVAESCTGGLLGAAITEVAGSSAYFLGGVISYSDKVKVEQLAVGRETLARHGAVSEETACAMAAGVRQLLHADFGVSITGVAGPAAEGSKPVGLTYIGIALESGVGAHTFQWSGTRSENRQSSVAAALRLLLEVED